MRPHAEPQAELIAAGNLATPRRTVLAVLTHLERIELPAEEVRSFLIESGLPPIALEEPDIPISLDQELAFIARAIERLKPPHSVVGHAVEVGLDANITLFGVLGLTLMHASSALESMRVLLSYPELCWGHCRVSSMRTENTLFISLVMDAKIKHCEASKAKLVRQYCVTVDLAATVRLIADLLGSDHLPSEVWLPYAPPRDHRRIEHRFGCKVRFGAPGARLYYRAGLWDEVPVLANPLAFKAYEKQTARLAKLLRTDVELSEQVRRLLWLSAPPPDRGSVASMLALSPRTLARKLAGEGTSYARLQREVQLARAQDYLRSPGLQVSEVAQRLGFSDATAFSRAFRTWSGEGPSTWRKRELARPGTQGSER